MKLAIIGAGFIGKIIAQEAKKLNVQTYCFAWEDGAVAKDSVDHFYPISVTDKEKILEECKKIGIDGVVPAASISIPTAAYISHEMGLIGNSPEAVAQIGNKYKVRELTKNIPELAPVGFSLVHSAEDITTDRFPIIIKPINGGGKAGLTVVQKKEDLQKAFEYGIRDNFQEFIAEEFIEGGREFSVESLSYHGKNYILQVTSKVSGGPPHCVELAHHQPADISQQMREKVETAIDKVLTAIGVSNGPCHTEIKIVDDKIYLIEVNGRLAGGHISHPLVELSTGYPYIQGVIKAALGCFEGINKEDLLHRFASVFFVTKQTEYLKPIFDECEKYDWCYTKHEAENKELITLTKNNGYRINYFIYFSENEPPKFAKQAE